RARAADLGADRGDAVELREVVRVDVNPAPEGHGELGLRLGGRVVDHAGRGAPGGEGEVHLLDGRGLEARAGLDGGPEERDQRVGLHGDGVQGRRGEARGQLRDARPDAREIVEDDGRCVRRDEALREGGPEDVRDAVQADALHPGAHGSPDIRPSRAARHPARPPSPPAAGAVWRPAAPTVCYHHLVGRLLFPAGLGLVLAACATPPPKALPKVAPPAPYEVPAAPAAGLQAAAPPAAPSVPALSVPAPPAHTVDDERFRVPVGASPVRGEAGAPVTIIEFADLQCPY